MPVSLRLPLFVGSLACVLAGTGDAQTEAARVAAIVRTGDSQGLQHLREQRLSIGGLIDGLLAARPGMDDGRWSLKAGTLLRDRDQDLAQCWREQPGRRSPAAELFAVAWPADWVTLHRQAAPAERADIEAVVALLATDLHRFEPALRSDDADQRASAERLTRIVAVAVRSRPLPSEVAALQQRDGDFDLPRRQEFDAFTLAPLLTSSDRMVRARAAAMLRHFPAGGSFAARQRLPLPSGLRQALAADKARAMRELACSADHLQEADLPLLIEAMTREPEQPLLQAPLDTAAWSTDARLKFAKAMIETGLGLLARPQRDDRDRLWLRAREWFHLARGLGRPAQQLLLANAVALADPDAAGCLLDPLIRYGFDPLLPGQRATMAPLVLALLDDDRLPVATVAANLLEVERDPLLVAKVGAMARAALASAPNGTAAILLAAAARAGDATLLPPLLERMRGGDTARAQAKPIDRQLLLKCLVALAPAADEQQALQLLQCLRHRARLPPYGNRARFATRPPDGLLEALILLGIYPRIPDEHCAWYEQHLPALAQPRDEDARDISCSGDVRRRYLEPHDDRSEGTREESIELELAEFQPVWFESLSEERVRRLLERGDICRPTCPLLYLRVPDLLAAAFAGDARHREAAVRVLAAGLDDHADAVQRLREQGLLPEPLVIMAALEAADWRTTARLLPTEPPLAYESQKVADRLAWDEQPSTAAELPLLRRLCAWSPADISIPAAWRAAALGAEGRELCRSTLARIFAADDAEAAVRALEVAVRLDLRLPQLQTRMAALAGQPEPHAQGAVIDGARLRFLDLHPRDLQRDTGIESLLLARHDADPATLRQLIAADAPRRLRQLLGSRPDRLLEGRTVATMSSALQLTGELPVWEAVLEDAVVQATTDPRPEVRRAAYLALSTRDPELWSCAWLVHEAVFDTDPAVRAAAR